MELELVEQNDKVSLLKKGGKNGTELLPIKENDDNYDKPDVGAKGSKTLPGMKLVQVCN